MVFPLNFAMSMEKVMDTPVNEHDLVVGLQVKFGRYNIDPESFIISVKYE